MNLLARIKHVFTREKVVEPDEVVAPEPIGHTNPLSYQTLGKIIETKHAEYKPDTTRHGGRIVKRMPKQLRKMKQAQEQVDDD